MRADFATSSQLEVNSTEELREAFASHRALRLCGIGSALPYLPAPEPDPDLTLLSLAPMRRILRLDPEDLTCSVEPGLPRNELDNALQPHGLELACAGGGSIAGLMAADLAGPLGPAQPGARGLLLGLEGMLADGTAFKAGARVVKNVAGFDLPKLFVGSAGSLFAATTLHLKLRPRPRAQLDFCVGDLELDQALQRCAALRQLAEPPTCLILHRDAEGLGLSGRLAGHPQQVANLQDSLALPACQPARSWQLPSPAPSHETWICNLRFSRLPALLALLPPESAFQYCGERCWWTVAAGQSEAIRTAGAEIWDDLRILSAPAALRRPATEAPGIALLRAGLKARFDPHNLLR